MAKTIGFFGTSDLCTTNMYDRLTGIISSAKNVHGYDRAMVCANDPGFSLAAMTACCEVGVPYTVVIPYIMHDEYWDRNDIESFARLVDAAWKVHSMGLFKSKDHHRTSTVYCINNSNLLVTDIAINASDDIFQYCVLTGNNVVSIAKDGIIRKIEGAESVMQSDTREMAAKVDSVAINERHIFKRRSLEALVFYGMIPEQSAILRSNKENDADFYINSRKRYRQATPERQEP